MWSGEIGGPANEQLAQIPGPLFGILTLFIGSCEAFRAVKGWKEPYGDGAELWALRDSYYPGDVGFDPLGLKPTDPAEFATMQTKELQNGRLAMLGVAGMCAQELVNHKTIAETLDFYQKYCKLRLGCEARVQGLGARPGCRAWVQGLGTRLGLRLRDLRVGDGAD